MSGRPDVHELAEPPADLPAEAREFWTETVAELIKVGIVDRVDVPFLRALATQYARMIQATRVIAVDGHFALGSVGQIREHPALKVERDATAMFLKIAEHFALTPVARVRLRQAELHRRSLQAEMNEAFGKPDLRPVGDVVVDADVVEG